MAGTYRNNIDELIRLGDEQADKANFAEAIEYYKQYLEKNPNDALLYNRIGYLYGKFGDFDYLDEQIKYFEKALELRPDYAMAIRNLALKYELVDKHEKSIEFFHKLFELDAVSDDYFAYACEQLRLGNFEEGWAFYESRFEKTIGKTEYPKIDKPRWEGQPILDKTLLVQYEQGFGDTFQFLRYLDVIRPLAKKIIFRVQNELLDLVKRNISWAEVVGISTPISELSFDFHTPLMSLPMLTNLTMATMATMETIPKYSNYLKADEFKIADYKSKFFDNDSFKVGISWAGMPSGNLHRNVPLKYYYPLAKVDNVKVYSFQKGFGINALEQLPEDIEIENLGATFKDFSDTAAAMANLDLFITSDNALFNLAGAMGVKTFVLLNKNSEWRWFFDEEKTPWYDNARIFKKQNECDSWAWLMGKAIEALKVELKEKIKEEI